MKERISFVLWSVVVVLLIATILLQFHMIAYTSSMRGTHPLQHEKLDKIIKHLEKP